MSVDRDIAIDVLRQLVAATFEPDEKFSEGELVQNPDWRPFPQRSEVEAAIDFLAATPTGLAERDGLDVERLAAALVVVITEPGETFLDDDAWTAIESALGTTKRFPPEMTAALGYEWTEAINDRERVRLDAEAALAARLTTTPGAEAK